MDLPADLTIIILCVLLKLLSNWKSSPKKTTESQKLIQEEKHKLVINPELDDLVKQKKEILETIQQLNTPSTFAKYSKKQRELVKIQSRIKSLQEAQSNQNQTSNNQPIKNQHPKNKAKQQSESKIVPLWLIVLLNVGLFSFSVLSSTQTLINNDKLPISLLVGQSGDVRCIWVFVACKMIL